MLLVIGIRYAMNLFSRLFVLALVVIMCTTLNARVSLPASNGKSSLGYFLDEHIFDSAEKVYVVRKSFDLQGRVIRIPGGTKLVFRGGRLVNGIIEVKGSPLVVANPSDKVILDHVYFRSPIEYGYQERCCVGICKDSWFVSSSDDDLLNMACAFDGVILTHEHYHLTQHNVDGREEYPSSYRLLSKSFSIESSLPSGSSLTTVGQITIIRQNMYGKKEDLGLSLKNLKIVAEGYSYSPDVYESERDVNKCFFGGALNNFNHKFYLSIIGCDFKGVFQLMQWNCYNEGLVADIRNSSFYCGGMAVEIYNGDEFKKLSFRAKNSSFCSYRDYALSFVSVDSDSRFDSCQVDGMELYHRGKVRFDSCIIRKYLTHSGPLTEGDVKVTGSVFQHGNRVYDSLICTFNGFASLSISDSRFLLGKNVLGMVSTMSNPVLLNIQRCPDVSITDSYLETDGDVEALKGKHMSLLWGDGSEKKVGRDGLKISDELVYLVK